MSAISAARPGSILRAGILRAVRKPESLVSLLKHVRWPWVAGLVALAFSIPAWHSGFQLDDYYHQAILRGDLELGCGSPILDLFTWSIGDPDRSRVDMERGLLPWWTSAGFRMKFFRPLAAVTHLFDQRFWPRQKWLMHVHSSLWFAAGSVAVGFLFRRLFAHAGDQTTPATDRISPDNRATTPSGQNVTWTNMAAAGLASAMYALRDEHAVTVAWIANRNLLLMTLFGALAWLCHCVWRERRSRAAGIGAPLLFGISLLSGESAVAVGGCLFAYAVILDRSTWRGKFLSLLPCGLVGVAWLVMYRFLECGACESGTYLDPRHDLLAFLVGFSQRAPVYFANSFGLMSANLFTFADAAGRNAVVAASVVMTLTMASIVWTTLRHDRLMQYFALCLVFALVPLCAGMATDRLTMLFNIPATGLIARFAQLKRNESRQLPKSSRQHWCGRCLAKTWIILHTGVAAALLPILILGFKASGEDLLESARSRALNHPELAHQDLILLNAPHGMYPLYMDFARLDEGLPRARCMHLLSGALSPFDVSRPDPQTLVVSVPDGLLNDGFSTLYRNPARQPLAAGTRIELPRFSVTILESRNGHPTRVAYRFPTSLDNPSLCLVEWRDNEYVPFVPPAVGDCRHVPRACAWTIFHLEPVYTVLGLQSRRQNS